MQEQEKIFRNIQVRLLATPFVKIAYIFGSHARKEATKKSDYDIAIETTDCSTKEFQWLWLQLMEDIEGRYKIDVVHVNTLSNEQLKKRIFREGKLFVQRI
ncbi:nucleotidyltransferase domain-containing protein [Bacillus sp. DX4.1]|uniref:nucleotidyltransferase domain-containing protein n=1 Tax=Bacillus sp. DX4.1 TaxID=3055867 RepID=UPI0025A14D63|nr:nucleotidyltransferase domain-containing protein [Bacillus sp. DX4.1]MDM5190507.1 nucleotidyltransferase domain-containing protein [Bacillus sp. DX4.1]